MNSVKIVYLNDTNKKQAVFKDNFHKLLAVLEPAGHVVVDLLVASDQAVFVKTWGGRVLLGTTDWDGKEAYVVS